MKRIWDSTRGIIFMGTPLRGATLADWAAIGASFVKLFRRTNVPLLSTLQRDSEVLERIRKDFMTQLKARYDTGGKTLKLKCFTEEVPVVGVGLVSQDSQPCYFILLRHLQHCKRFRGANALVASDCAT